MTNPVRWAAERKLQEIDRRRTNGPHRRECQKHADTRTAVRDKTLTT
ncbi:hypothetical protein ACWGII_29820 [Streptomyces sp. NPDC054855]